MAWKCPKCQSTHLSVEIKTTAKLVQYGDNFETEVEGDHEWSESSWMTCEDCAHHAKAFRFELDAPETRP